MSVKYGIAAGIFFLSYYAFTTFKSVHDHDQRNKHIKNANQRKKQISKTSVYAYLSSLLYSLSSSSESTTYHYSSQINFNQADDIDNEDSDMELNHSLFVDGIEGLIGNTPVVRIKSLSKLTGCDILGKAEFMNIGGSSKDSMLHY